MNNYEDINKSLDIFYKWAKRGMTCGQIKEKYFTTRWYANLNDNLSLNNIFYPMYIYYQLPDWCRKVDKYFLNPVFGKLAGKWRIYCYRKAYHFVLKNYPNISHGIDHPELLNKTVLLEYKKSFDKTQL
jgi:hypothetical protein